MEVRRAPIELFRDWMAEAVAKEPHDPTAMTLATVDERGFPSARVVLLKGFDERGFVFYTNRGSRKGRDLDATKRAALVLHWASLERQVRVEGSAERVSDEESDAYFATRPRGSQLGAWASSQSEHLDSREELEAKLAEFDDRFAGVVVPRPPFWGGYRVQPARIEFWQGKPDRLHDRLVFTREADGAWSARRLYP